MNDEVLEKVIENENIETEKIETENIETEKIETENIETEKIETENIETEKIENENIETLSDDVNSQIPVVLVNGNEVNYYETILRLEVYQTLFLMLILFSIIVIFSMTRFYRYFRSLFTIDF